MADGLFTPLSLDALNDGLKEEIRSVCGVDVDLCLECGKCSGGCPNGHRFDYTPRKIIQLVKLGDEETLMTMDALWICLSCQLCLDRCPSGIDTPRVLDYLRERAYRSEAKTSRPLVKLFNEVVLDSIKRAGHVSELDVVVNYSRRTGRYTKDARLGLKMLFKGKLLRLRKKVKKSDEIRELFEKSRAAKGHRR